MFKNVYSLSFYYWRKNVWSLGSHYEFCWIKSLQHILCIMFHLQELGNKSEQTAQGLHNLDTSTVKVMQNLSVCLLTMISSAIYMFVHLKNYWKPWIKEIKISKFFIDLYLETQMTCMKTVNGYVDFLLMTVIFF